MECDLLMEHLLQHLLYCKRLVETEHKEVYRGGHAGPCNHLAPRGAVVQNVGLSRGVRHVQRITELDLVVGGVW